MRIASVNLGLRGHQHAPLVGMLDEVLINLATNRRHANQLHVSYLNCL